MKSHEENSVIKWNQDLPRDIEITLNLTDDGRGEALHDFCKELSALAPRVRVVERFETDSRLPSIQIGSSLRYSAVPAGPELEPFLYAASVSGDGSTLISRSAKAKLEQVNGSTTIKVYITQSCPTCPGVIRQMIPLPVINEHLQLEIIDITLFPELIEPLGIQGVPTTMIGDDFRWTGAMPLEELIEALTSHETSSLSFSTLDRMLQEGKAQNVAEMMLEKEFLFPAFPDLLVADNFVTRLGAMTAMEEILQRNNPLAYGIISPLWQRFEQVIEPIQIDLLYLFGEAGDRETVPLLSSVMQGQHRAHVKEIAQEAIDSINKRHPL